MMRERDSFPTAVEATFLVVALMAIEFVINAAFYDARIMSGVDPRDVSGAIVVFGNGVLFSVLMHYKGMRYGSLFHASKTPVAAVIGTLILPVLCIVPALILAVWTLTLILQQLPMGHWQEALCNQMMSDELVALVTVCLIAPVVEEMLFRGIILRAFLVQYSRSQAIVGSAILFGVAHLNIFQFVAAVLVGSISGWLYERTRSLWPSIILHMAFNGVSMLLYYANEGAAEEWQPSLAHWGAAFVLAFIGTVMLQRLLLVRAKT
jgi:membrane protease YdiL (CAAX protease family)